MQAMKPCRNALGNPYWAWSPGIQAERSMTCSGLTGEGSVTSALRSAQAWTTASLPGSLTESQAWLFSQIAPLIFTNPLS